jgi:outer membrane lipoprotein LolB
MVRRFLATALVCLSGCAQLPEMPQGRYETGGFDMAGRFSVRFQEEVSTGRVQWRHELSSDDLLITNPLGQGLARITRKASGVELSTADGKSFSAADAESLTERVLGWPLPLEGLPQWIQGRASAGAPAEFIRDESARLVELRQEGWRISYEDYQGDRPGRVILSRPGLQLRMVVDSFAGSP